LLLKNKYGCLHHCEEAQRGNLFVFISIHEITLVILSS
jgi:hypothetical protein